MNIDFVITWVDMNDPKWQSDFAIHSKKIDNTKNEVSEARFRDYGFLKYWFRGVEKFAPWVRKIHFVTCGQKPEWLDENHPKLQLVNHEDYIPKQFLPCFNSSLIEIYLHRIPDLADHFVYFNDDFFIINHILKNRFFSHDMPCDIATFRYNSGIGLWSKCLKNNIKIINQHFDKQEVINRDRNKWFNSEYGSKANLTKFLKWHDRFITLRTPHNAQPYLKATYEDVWANYEQELTKMSANRFRSKDDYTQELFRTWQICKGNFEPYNTYKDTKMFPLVLRSKSAIKAIQEQKYSLICLNDNVHIRNYQRVMGNIESAFESILPEKSSFEI